MNHQFSSVEKHNILICSPSSSKNCLFVSLTRLLIRLIDFLTLKIFKIIYILSILFCFQMFAQQKFTPILLTAFFFSGFFAVITFVISPNLTQKFLATRGFFTESLFYSSIIKCFFQFSSNSCVNRAPGTPLQHSLIYLKLTFYKETVTGFHLHVVVHGLFTSVSVLVIPVKISRC